jgi:hypothetical protein
LWGVVSGFVANAIGSISIKRALFLGLILGVVSMVDVYFFIPQVMKALHGVDFWNQEIPMGWDWVAHLVFGASFVVYPKVQRRLTGKTV